MHEGRYKLTGEMIRGNNAWLRSTVHAKTARQVIAEALAKPAPESPDGKFFVPPGGFAPPQVN